MAQMQYLGLNIDFSAPSGAPSFVGPESISWRVFKNPVVLAIGGVAAVLLELAEPRVRSGVWDHSGFRERPMRRMRRTGMAAMVTVYAPRETAADVIANVNRMHARVHGQTPDGQRYRATDPDLLNWVHATAGYGFVEAYSKYARLLSDTEKDQYYDEAQTAARHYGATGSPASLKEQSAFFNAMTPKLEFSDIIPEFLSILRRTLPAPRDILVRAAVDILPTDIRDNLQLHEHGLSQRGMRVVRKLAATAERVPAPLSPPVLACKRLGLPGAYLYRSR